MFCEVFLRNTNKEGYMDIAEFFDLFKSDIYYKDHDEVHEFYMSFQKHLKKVIESFFIHNKEFLEDLDKAHLRESSFVDSSEEDISNWLQSTIGNSGRTFILEFLVMKHLIIWFRGSGSDEMFIHFARVLQVQMKKFIAEAPHYLDEFWWKESFSNLLADYYFNRESGGGPFWC